MKLIYCGPPLWAMIKTETISYVFQSDDGKREVEIVVFHGDGEVILYPCGIDEHGNVRAVGVIYGGLLSAQLHAAELLGVA